MTNLHIPADRLTTECPTCAGLGQELTQGRLVPCSDCEGLGRVEAFTVYDYFDGCDDAWVEPVPKEARTVNLVIVS